MSIVIVLKKLRPDAEILGKDTIAKRQSCIRIKTQKDQRGYDVCVRLGLFVFL